MSLTLEELKKIDDRLTPELELAFRKSWYDGITDENTWFQKFAVSRTIEGEEVNIAWDEAVAYADDVAIHQKGPDFLDPVYDSVLVKLRKQVSRGIKISSLRLNGEFAAMAMRQAQQFPRIIRNLYHQQLVDSLENGTDAAAYPMADGQALFSNTHEVGFTKAAFDNLDGGALTGPKLASVIDNLMTVPMGPTGEPFLTRGMSDIFLVVPNALRYTAMQIINSTMDATDNKNTENVFQGIANLIVEERLADPDDWYVIVNGPSSEPYIFATGSDPMSDRLISPTDPQHIDSMTDIEWALWSYKAFGIVFPINYWQMVKVVN